MGSRRHAQAPQAAQARRLGEGDRRSDLRSTRPARAGDLPSRGLGATDCGCRGPSQEVTCMVNDSAVVVFDDERAVANARVMLPAALATRLGIEQLVDQTV